MNQTNFNSKESVPTQIFDNDNIEIQDQIESISIKDQIDRNTASPQGKRSMAQSDIKTEKPRDLILIPKPEN